MNGDVPRTVTEKASVPIKKSISEVHCKVDEILECANWEVIYLSALVALTHSVSVVGRAVWSNIHLCSLVFWWIIIHSHLWKLFTVHAFSKYVAHVGIKPHNFCWKCYGPTIRANRTNAFPLRYALMNMTLASFELTSPEMNKGISAGSHSVCQTLLSVPHLLSTLSLSAAPLSTVWIGIEPPSTQAAAFVWLRSCPSLA